MGQLAKRLPLRLITKLADLHHIFLQIDEVVPQDIVNDLMVDVGMDINQPVSPFRGLPQFSGKFVTKHAVLGEAADKCVHLIGTWNMMLVEDSHKPNGLTSIVERTSRPES